MTASLPESELEEGTYILSYTAQSLNLRLFPLSPLINHFAVSITFYRVSAHLPLVNLLFLGTFIV